MRDMPSSNSVETWVFPSGQAHVIFRKEDFVTNEADTWWYVYHNGKAGWVRDSDVRMTAVNVTASDLADEIFKAIDTSSHELLK
jgi:hypothetical protein